MENAGYSPQKQPQSVFLPISVEESIDKICSEKHVPPLGHQARCDLSSVGEEKALEVIRTIAGEQIKRTFDGFVIHMVKKITGAANSPMKRLCMSTSSPNSPQQPSRRLTPTRLMMHHHCESVSPVTPIPMHLDEKSSAGSNSVPNVQISPQLQALGELEFRKAFLILSYIGQTRLEDVLSEGEIRGMKYLSMVRFEAEIYRTVGHKCGVHERDRRKYLDWDSGRTHTYHCHVYPDGSYRFKGPYLATISNFLQRALGDENVLLVKLAEESTYGRSSATNHSEYYAKYSWLVREGIPVGLRRYRFFVFKDGGKEEKKKDPTTSPVKCYFICVESHASSESPDYILFGKTIREARSLFMNVDTLSSLSKYMARFSLILSKTMSVEIDWSSVNIERIDDIPCQDGNGKVIEDKDGKLLIHTDGTGFISEDLALKCLVVYKGKCISSTNTKPLLIQFRLFNNGSAVKGTFLVKKKLPPETMQIRPSMIKVEPSTSNINTKSSLEIVGTSNRPKRAYLSRNLIALLSYGGVPEKFFMDILENTLLDAQGALSKKRTALGVAANYGEMDDFIVAQMILSGIPLEESYLQQRLRALMKEEKKNLKVGKLPVPESYYLMGTVDPTGLLEKDEVCIILDNGHVSGRVLVYRNPGLHFGDVHVLTATYVKALEDFVGNAKYAIFFPCKGPRSLADEIAGGDYDGDMYFVSRNPELLEYFKPSEPWISSSLPSNVSTKKPSEFPDEDLEDELFKYFLLTRFQPSYTVGVAADSWLAIMDRLLTLPDDSDERLFMKRNMCRLIDIYYDALDAPKKGGAKIEVPEDLKADMFPHYMERNEDISYTSTSILGLIYDKVKSYQEDEESSKTEVWKLPYFENQVSASSRLKWEQLYGQYRQDMTAALDRNIDINRELKNESADEVVKKYKQLLYEAPEFEESKRPIADVFEDALALYEVCYDYAKSRGDVSRCGFAWKLAGRALCKYYIISQSEHSITCVPSVLKEMFG
ncbi:probable RNA-dependent RNA polymerase 5 [Mercurialis annua]|uniref:probable RNA-dependent RNA polymerase 5 n=1 Tax=Mercurialis annua TaxID=3986 RepID=UPI00215E6249|nr:probable RNA-dependent RNA polymerase 5 [Mercurialis annua]